MDRLLKYWPILLALAAFLGALLSSGVAYLLEQREDKIEFHRRLKRMEDDKQTDDKLLLDMARRLFDMHFGHPHEHDRKKD